MTDELVAEFYRAIRKYWTATNDARVSIVDFSFVTKFALSNEIIHELAEREPCIPDATTRARFIVAPNTLEFGLSRMFKIVGAPTRRLLTVVRTVEEALAELDIRSPDQLN